MKMGENPPFQVIFAESFRPPLKFFEFIDFWISPYLPHLEVIYRNFMDGTIGDKNIYSGQRKNLRIIQFRSCLKLHLQKNPFIGCISKKLLCSICQNILFFKCENLWQEGSKPQRKNLTTNVHVTSYYMYHHYFDILYKMSLCIVLENEAFLCSCPYVLNCIFYKTLSMIIDQTFFCLRMP